MKPTWKTLWTLALFSGLLASGVAPAAGQSASPVAAVFPAPEARPTRPADITAPTVAPPTLTITEAEWKALRQRLDTLESRLGPSSRPSSMAHNMERSLADLERQVQQLKQTVNHLQSMETRIRKLEMK